MKRPPAFDLMEQPFGRGWMIVCDFCSKIRFLKGDHRDALLEASRSGWAYTSDGFNVCPGCTSKGVR